VLMSSRLPFAVLPGVVAEFGASLTGLYDSPPTRCYISELTKVSGSGYAEPEKATTLNLLNRLWVRQPASPVAAD
jgi:hypothetical protein